MMAGVFSAKAQDVITLKSGEEIKAKVTEVSATEVKYKRFDNLDGPTIVIEKQDVFFINYENGTREVINSITEDEPSDPTAIPTGGLYAVGVNVYQGGLPLNKEQVRDVLASNPQALQLYNKGIRKGRNGIIMGITGSAILITNAALMTYRVVGLIDGIVFFGVGVGLLVPGYLVMPKKAKTLVNNAVSTYNGGISSTQAELKIGFTGTGIAFVLNF